MRLGVRFMVPMVLASAPSWAAVITFDDLTTKDSFFTQGINDTYQGYVWSTSLTGSQTVANGWASATVAQPAVAPAPTPVSGNSYAWNWGGTQSLFVQFGTATDFTGVYFATLSSAYGINSQTIQVFGYDASNTLVDTGSVMSLADSFQFYSANFSGIYTVEFRADPDKVYSLFGDRGWFSLDDITLNENSSVPEPASGLLLLLGGVGIAGFRRRLGK